MCTGETDKEVKLISGKAIKVDACIAPLVQMLNDYGIETLASCCGHGKTAKSGIRISAQNVQVIPLGEDLTIHLKFPYQGKIKEFRRLAISADLREDNKSYEILSLEGVSKPPPKER